MNICRKNENKVDSTDAHFKFVVVTIIYSFMQAVGMVTDHLTDCSICEEILKAKCHQVKG